MVHFSHIVPFSFLVITFLVSTLVVATAVQSPATSTDGSKYPNLSCVNSSDCQLWINGICEGGVCVCLDRSDPAKNVCVEVPTKDKPKPATQCPKSVWNDLVSIFHGFWLALLVVVVLPVTVFICAVVGCAWCACLGTAFCSTFRATINFGQPEQKNQDPGGLKTGLKAGSSSGGTNSDGPSSSSGQTSSIPTSTQA